MISARENWVSPTMSVNFLTASHPGFTVLYYSPQFGSHSSRTPLSITKFGRGHMSLGPLSNLQVVMQAPNYLEKKKKAKKIKFSVQMPNFLGCHAKFRSLLKCRIGKMGHVSPPPVDLIGIVQYGQWWKLKVLEPR